MEFDFESTEKTGDKLEEALAATELESDKDPTLSEVLDEVTGSIEVGPVELEEVVVTRHVSQDEINHLRIELARFGYDVANMSAQELVTTHAEIQQLADEQVEVLSKGAVNDTLALLIQDYVPKGHVGEFIHESGTEIARAKAHGWLMAEYPPDDKQNKSLTGAADNLVRCGDLVLAYMPRSKYAAMMIAKDRRLAIRRGRRQKAQGQDGQVSDPVGGEQARGLPLRPNEQLTGV